jgi:hypothetical protein
VELVMKDPLVDDHVGAVGEAQGTRCHCRQGPGAHRP